MMRTTSVVLAGVAVAFLAGTAGTAFAQAMDPTAAPGVTQDMKRKAQNSSGYRKRGSAKYRPLTVSAPPAPGAEGANSLARPIGASLGVADTAIGGAGAIGAGVVGGALTGATGVVGSTLGALGGGPVGISPDAAPPLPIEARYAHTGKVFSSYDEGYAQDVPVDASGPIYKINDKAMRKVTPFTLAAFPIAGLATGITAPFRPATP